MQADEIPMGRKRKMTRFALDAPECCIAPSSDPPLEKQEVVEAPPVKPLRSCLRAGNSEQPQHGGRARSDKCNQVNQLVYFPDNNQSNCLKPRPPGCTHLCKLPPNHRGSCPECTVPVSMWCYCNSKEVVLPCRKWLLFSDETKMKLLTCTNRCTKYLSCGHRCSYHCHPGDCSRAEMCNHKVILYCQCGRLQKTYKCYQAQTKAPDCNSMCMLICTDSELELKSLEKYIANDVRALRFMRAADLEVKMKHQDEYQERVLKREALKKQAFNRRQSIVFFLMIGILLGVVLLVYMVKLMI